MKGPIEATLIIIVALIPLLFLALVVTVPGQVKSQVKWEPPVLWMTEFGTVGPLLENRVTAVSAGNSGLYASGFVGRTFSEVGNDVNATNSYLFLKKYDFNGREAWTQRLGSPKFSVITGVALGTDGVYIVGGLNGTPFVQKHDLNGKPVWTSQFQDLYSQVMTISVGDAGVYVGGLGPEIRYGTVTNGTRTIMLRGYDFDGNVVWTSHVANVTGAPGSFQVNVNAYAGPAGIYVTGSNLLDAFASDTHAFVGKYDLNGVLEWTRSFDSPPGFTCSCAPMGISGDAAGFYVAGLTQTAFPGQSFHSPTTYWDMFVRKYDWDGSELWTIQFAAPDFSLIDGIGVSANASGVYVVLGSGSNGFLMRYDGNGRRVWSLPLQRYPAALSVGENAVYVGGSLGPGYGHSAFLASFGQSSSLILFGLNPPSSFLLAGLIVGIPILSVLWLRRWWKKRGRPISTSLSEESKAASQIVR